jgi:1-aminocyclopropane-1-carboxylate deaminase/D-cysteine desulfhydrase-like pyridoxal-dependent ACC family enzyme
MLERVPRLPLLDGPTPLEALPRFGASLGRARLWVKRDDCMALGFGGNKLRSLEYWLGAARAEGADMLVVAGALASNQCRLTAAAAAKVGLDALVLYAGDVDAPLRGNAALTRLYGATIRRLGPVSEAERSRLAQEAIAELRAQGRRPYLIGDPVLAAFGYVRCVEEVRAQARDLDLRHIVLPGAMGPTEAGVVYAVAALDLPWTVHLVSVEYDAETLRARLAAILDGMAARLGQPAPRGAPARVRIEMGQLGAGYGAPTQASLAAAAALGRLEALTLEQTYVAKTFAGLAALIGDGVIPREEAACVVHTGGGPAFFEQTG